MRYGRGHHGTRITDNIFGMLIAKKLLGPHNTYVIWNCFHLLSILKWPETVHFRDAKRNFMVAYDPLPGVSLISPKCTCTKIWGNKIAFWLPKSELRLPKLGKTLSHNSPPVWIKLFSCQERWKKYFLTFNYFLQLLGVGHSKLSCIKEAKAFTRVKIKRQRCLLFLTG